jgi:hypothetical protein
MSAATLERPASEQAPRERDERPFDDETWACGLPADAGPEAQDRCASVVPELIVELL